MRLNKKEKTVSIITNSGRPLIFRVVSKGKKFLTTGVEYFNNIPAIEILHPKLNEDNSYNAKDLFGIISFQNIFYSKGYLKIKNETFKKEDVEKLKRKLGNIILNEN